MTDIEVRGGATDEELAAVLAALVSGGRRPETGHEDDGYARWRRGRRQALSGRFLARR
ncbi:MAG TPA: acyl-CoA carboxylase epsilon subunit [Jatrophihabitantaceae bacterium]|nr:acyl-CoA carboxylase epsilon subunit [Jatrophihabitantaceae bacterium]